VLYQCYVLRVLASERDPVRTAAKFVIKLSTESKNVFVAVGLVLRDSISRV
jgi:hypothetical protein